MLSHLKPLIKNGTIKTFGDIFNHVSVKAVAEAINRSPKHVETVRKNYGKLTLGDLHGLAEAIGIGWVKVAELFTE